MPTTPNVSRPLERDLKHEFTAIIERDGDWFVAYCPEIPGANGQGKTKQEAADSLGHAVGLILEDRLEDGLRGMPDDAEREALIIERNGPLCSGTFANTVVT